MVIMVVVAVTDQPEVFRVRLLQTRSPRPFVIELHLAASCQLL